MDNLLKTSTVVITPLLITASVIILFSGHNSPGGGFIGGLILGLCFFYKNSSIQKKTSVKRPVLLMAVGCAITIASGLISFAYGQEFLKGMWKTVNIPFLGGVGISNIVLFDVGVYFSVAGVVYLILSLAWEDANG